MTTELDYMALLKSVAKVEDDKYEYMVDPHLAVDAMELAVDNAILIVIDLIDKYWRFDNGQMPLSNWHEKQDLIEKIKEI